MQQIGKLNLRLNDFMDELNKTFKVFFDEIQAKDAEILKLKGQVITEANKDVMIPTAKTP